MSRDPEAPPRLIDSLGPAGDCLRSALQEQSPPLTIPRFVELRERRQRRARRQRGLLLSSFAAATILGAAALRPQEPPASIHAELASAARRAEPATTEASEPPHLAPEPPAEPPPAAPVVKAPTAVVSATAPRGVKARAAATVRPDEEKNVVESDSAGGARACAELTRRGAAEQAIACYEALARGTGMVAELALFEQARLEGKMLRRPERALLKLDSYRKRFPQGALRAEVMLAQIEWLLASGDKAQARRLVDEALDSGLLKERMSELERLRRSLVESAPP